MIYTYKNKLYTIVCESKFKKDGVWVDVVIYCAMYNNADGQIWVREKREFYTLFSRVDSKI